MSQLNVVISKSKLFRKCRDESKAIMATNNNLQNAIIYIQNIRILYIYKFLEIVS